MIRELMISTGAREYVYGPPITLEEEPTDDLLSRLGVAPNSVISRSVEVRDKRPVWLVKVK
jgi:hypothetical protein